MDMPEVLETVFSHQGRFFLIKERILKIYPYKMRRYLKRTPPPPRWSQIMWSQDG
jgi:hypothetical protein